MNFKGKGSNISPVVPLHSIQLISTESGAQLPRSIWIFSAADLRLLFSLPLELHTLKMGFLVFFCNQRSPNRTQMNKVSCLKPLKDFCLHFWAAEKSTPRKPLSVSGNRYRTVSKSGQRPLPFQIWDLGNIVEGAPHKIKLQTVLW